MLRFEEINYAYLLVLIPILVLAYKISRQQNTSMWKQLGNPLLLVKYLYAHGKLVRFRQWILFIVFILLIISLVNPQMGKKKRNPGRRTLMFLLHSMFLKVCSVQTFNPIACHAHRYGLNSLFIDSHRNEWDLFHLQEVLTCILHLLQIWPLC